MAVAIARMRFLPSLYHWWRRIFQSKGERCEAVLPRSFWQVIPLIAVTDLAFSLDSVTTAIAISQELWLIILGGTIGIVLLRFLAGLFIHWLEEFLHLETAGYIAVALVGTRLLLRVLAPELVPSEWMMVGLIAIAFAWGFSQRTYPVGNSSVKKLKKQAE